MFGNTIKSIIMEMKVKKRIEKERKVDRRRIK